MRKGEFIEQLRTALSGLPQQDIEERLSFYSEMIDDRVEEGMTEEEAVGLIEPIPEIVEKTVTEIPITRLVKESVKPKRSLRAWEIVLLILGFPLWFPLLVAAGAVLLSLYVVLWSLIIAAWAIEVSLWACALAGVVAAVLYFVKGQPIAGVAMIGAAVFFAGLSIFGWIGCAAACKGILRLTKKVARGIKSLFIRKERQK